MGLSSINLSKPKRVKLGEIKPPPPEPTMHERIKKCEQSLGENNIPLPEVEPIRNKIEKKTSIRAILNAPRNQTKAIIERDHKPITENNYSLKLKDPRWQRKRLEIFSRDNWACQICGDKLETLHIHHKSYIRGNNPWEYDESYLMTVCATCHGVIEETKKRKDNFDIDKAKAYCIMDGDNAMTIYRYDKNKSILVVKRGDNAQLSDNDINEIVKLISIK